MPKHFNLRLWQRIPVYPGRHLHSNGFEHVPCWHPGKTWHSLQVAPAHPNRQRHSPGASQYPLVWWQSVRQMAGIGSHQHKIIIGDFVINSNEVTYVHCRKAHPSLCYRHIRKKRYIRHAGNQAMEYNSYKVLRRIRACSDIRQDDCSILWILFEIVFFLCEWKDFKYSNTLKRIASLSAYGDVA